MLFVTDLVRTRLDAIPMATMQWWEEEANNQDKAVSKLVKMMLQVHRDLGLNSGIVLISVIFRLPDASMSYR